MPSVEKELARQRKAVSAARDIAGQFASRFKVMHQRLDILLGQIRRRQTASLKKEVREALDDLQKTGNELFNQADKPRTDYMVSQQMEKDESR